MKNDVIHKELASLNRDFVAVAARLRRINDLFLDFTDDRPRPVVHPAGELLAQRYRDRAKEGINITHTFNGTECFCPPGHGHTP